MATNIRLGIVGGGQLGQMLALSGVPLGVTSVFLDPSHNPPARFVGDVIPAPYNDLHAVRQLVRRSEVVTYELEGVDAGILSVVTADEGIPLRPPASAATAMQDRLHEKTLCSTLGIPTAEWRPVESMHELENAVSQLGLPALLKRRTGGYDGRGQLWLRRESDLDEASRMVGSSGCILEQEVPFEREISLVATMGLDGTFRAYPLVENQHRGGILRLTLAPAPALTSDLQMQAESYALLIANHLGYVGTIALEFFEFGGQLLVNEIAPRVHNSGHWTIEGAEASQFQNHVRAILGLPLGDTAALGHFAMVNIIGSMPDVSAILSQPGLSLHLYGKEARPGRKLGHVTFRAGSSVELRRRLKNSGLIDDVSGI